MVEYLMPDKGSDQFVLRAGRWTLLVILLLFATATLACTSEARFSREQAVEAAKKRATESAPEVGMLSAEIDAVEANLSAGVWQVRVRGRFLFEGMAPPGGRAAVYEARERRFMFDASSGRFLGGQMPDTRLVSPAVLPTPAVR